MSFFGEYSVSVDSKGRISIPNALRDILAKEYGCDGLVVTRREKGLVAFPPNEWQKIREKVLAEPASQDRDLIVRNRISPAAECKFNSQGRIQIPNSLRKAAGLKVGEAVIVGMIDKIEIWDLEAHEAFTAESEALLKADPQKMTDLGF